MPSIVSHGQLKLDAVKPPLNFTSSEADLRQFVLPAISGSRRRYEIRLLMVRLTVERRHSLSHLSNQTSSIRLCVWLLLDPHM